MTNAHFLHHIFSPEKFSLQELDIIVPKFRKISFLKNEFLLKEGITENRYWFIESGFARSYDIVIDWSSFFLRTPTRENIQALTDCQCWQIDIESFQILFNDIKTFRDQGRTTLAGSYFALKNHSISMIADPAKERYLHLLKTKPNLVRNISLKHIATYLGITDTSLSRIRKEISGE